jgi:Ni/Co efflux regulator RcnB
MPQRPVVSPATRPLAGGQQTQSLYRAPGSAPRPPIPQGSPFLSTGRYPEGTHLGTSIARGDQQRLDARLQETSRRGRAGGVKSQPSIRTEVRPGHAFLYNGVSHPQLRVQPYRYPAGFAYRRYYAGRPFPRTLWSRQYYIYNYVDFGLAPPAPGAQWMRFGSDLLLVDLDTGLVAQVVFGAFDDGSAPEDAGD